MELKDDSKQYAKFGPWLKASATVAKGDKRPTMEDRVCISKFTYKEKTYYVFLLLDGHAGPEVADYTNQHFTEILSKEVVKYDGTDLRNVIKNTFININRLVSHFQSGSTASLLLAVEKDKQSRPDIWIANVGDSTIYGISPETGARKISIDHNIKNDSERERVLAEGSLSIVDGYVATTQGNMLAITRALGDADFGSIVTAEPHVINVKYKYPIFALASDGLWDVVKGNEVWQRLNSPKELRTWRDSAFRINQWRNATYAQHDNSSLILVYVGKP
jgi:serine/threonine protein phosphatase PrpC